MSAKTIYFIEDYDPSLHYRNGMVLSASPMASYVLGKAGIPYTILENYYSERALRADSDDYFEEQMAWVNSIDCFLKANVCYRRENDFSVAEAHFNRLKYVVDSIVSRAYALQAFLKATEPEQIVYVAENRNQPHEPSIYNLHDRALCSYASLLHAWSQEFGGITLSCNYLSGRTEGRKRENSENLFKRLEPPWWSCGLRSARSFLLHRKYERLIPTRGSRLKSILFLDSGVQPIDSIIGELIRKGHRVFLKSPQGIFEKSSLWEKCVLDLRNGILRAGSRETSRSIQDDCGIASHKLMDSNLMDWIDKKCGFRVREVALPYLRHFVRTICAETCLEFDALKKFYQDYAIDCVIARASSGINYPSALLAAKQSGVRRVCVQHSSGVTDDRDWAFDEINFFDHLFTMCTPLKDYFEACSNRDFDGRCQVSEFPRYLKSVKSRRNAKRAGKLQVVYAPRKLAAWGIPHLNSVAYPITWYFELEKSIVSFFAKRKDCEFIYKYGKGQAWMAGSILPLICGAGLENVRVEDGPFVRYLETADRVIFDYPSTGLFEAARAGVPALALYHETVKIWEPMLKMFGKSLQVFTTADDAVVKIGEFLRNDPELYKADLPLSDDDRVDQLLSELGRTRVSSAVTLLRAPPV